MGVLEKVPPYRAFVKIMLLSEKKTLKGDGTVVFTKEAMPKEVYVAEKLKEEKAQEEIERTLLHAPLVAQEHEVPHLQKPQKETKDEHHSQFLEVSKKLQINIPFAEVSEQRPLSAALLKGLLSEKNTLKGDETKVLTKECSALIQNKLPRKMLDLGSFQILCTIENIAFDKVLCDLGSSINLMSLSIMKKMGIQEA
ncbi:uncharacterized protein LOC110273603 [Arachis duranensis]|uniref:Uncharacterized protein LOC110273603 n=1 Tax=Arachis duranensis TaxID=130453 RepID=A0A6P5MBA3_ARADU|nr:uncharacterized protein LOC110273603 [Arachis duranensis]